MRCGSPDWNPADPFGMARMHRRMQRQQRAMHRQMHRDQRAFHLRNMRRMRDVTGGRACGGGWWIWMIFPLVFGVLPALRSMNWPSLPSPPQIGAALSPLAPVSRYLGDLLGMDPGLVNAVLLAAIVVNAGAVLLALRVGGSRA